MKIIFFLGYSGSGKTTAIESVVRGLTKSGLKVGTLKHIHDPEFTIDTPGKDTWRHANAGAQIVVVLAPKESAIIRRGDTARMDFHQILRVFEDDAADFVFVEGLHSMLDEERRESRSVLHVICAVTEKDALELSKQHPKPLCIAGRITCSEKFKSRKHFRGIPLVRFPDDTPRFLRLIGYDNSSA